MEERFDDLEFQEPKGSRIRLIALLFVLLAAMCALLMLLRSREAPAPAPEAAPLPGGILELDLLPAGEGECFLFLSPNGKTMLVNAGTGESSGEIAAWLEERGIRKIDALVLNLSGQDSADGAEALLEAVPVESLWISPLWRDEPFLAGVLRAAEEQGTEVRSAYGSTVSLLEWDPDTEVRILSPYETAYPDPADAGLVLRVQYGSSAVLLAGGIGELSEKLIVKALPNHLLRAKILTVSPGAGGGADSKKFLNAVRPVYALCAGENAKPGSAARARLQEAAVELLVPQSGETVRFFLDGAEARMVE